VDGRPRKRWRAALQQPVTLKELPPQKVKGVEKAVMVWVLGD
jgi:hypothetical protein